MVQPRDDLRFTSHTLTHFRALISGIQYFDRHLSRELGILGQIDRSHSPASNFANDSIVTIAEVRLVDDLDKTPDLFVGELLHSISIPSRCRASSLNSASLAVSARKLSRTMRRKSRRIE